MTARTRKPQARSVKAYHFTAGAVLRDGRPVPPIGEWLVHEGPIVPCALGLHASKHPFDALKYARGATLHMVELDGDIVEHAEAGQPADKLVGRRRRIVATIDANRVLRLFAVWCARSALKLIDTPDPRSVAACDVAERFANGQASREELAAARDAARDAARAAARAAARDAARAAAWAAARDAARAAAWAAARDAARIKAERTQRTVFVRLVRLEFAAAARNAGAPS